MVSTAFPSADAELTEAVRFGARWSVMDKPAFFNPNEIEDSGFGIARHTCSPTGNVVRPEQDEILLLHYKFLGLEYVLKRHAELNARRRALDVEKKYGYHYDEAVTREKHDNYLATATELFTEQTAIESRRRIKRRPGLSSIWRGDFALMPGLKHLWARRSL